MNFLLLDHLLTIRVQATTPSHWVTMIGNLADTRIQHETIKNRPFSSLLLPSTQILVIQPALPLAFNTKTFLCDWFALLSSFQRYALFLRPPPIHNNGFSQTPFHRPGCALFSSSHLCARTGTWDVSLRGYGRFCSWFDVSISVDDVVVRVHVWRSF